MGNLEEYSPKLSYDRGAMVEFEGKAYVASEDINIGEDDPDENSPAWIEPSIYLGSSFIMSESGALPKLLEGTKINVFVEWQKPAPEILADRFRIGHSGHSVLLMPIRHIHR